MMLIPLSSTECTQSLSRLKSRARKRNRNNIHAELRCQKLKFESKTTPKPETRIPLGQDTTTPESPHRSHCKLHTQKLQLSRLAPGGTAATTTTSIQKAKQQDPKRRGDEEPFRPQRALQMGDANYRLLSFQLKTTAEHWEPPEGLDFIRAACGASSHSYGIRLKYPSSSKWF